MRKLFYYLRDAKNHPIITVALIELNDGTISRGVAICSKQEKSFTKEAGRTIAINRAEMAIEMKGSAMPIRTPRAIKRALECTGNLSEEFIFNFKSNLNPLLTPFEEELLARRGTDGTIKTEA
jgi:hypothetical protein